MSFSLALLGAGYLVGLSVGMAMLLGLLIGWAGAVPILTSMQPNAALSAADHAADVWTHHVRFIGAGAMAVAAIWTLAKLAGPVVRGVIGTISASQASRAGTAERRDTDLSIRWIAVLTLACLIVIAELLVAFLRPTILSANTVALVIAAIPFIFIGGFLIAAICGYMAGLIGASNSPISG